MNRFLQLHLLTSYPPSNLNRDDLGRPKTAVMGGAMRLRVSSQSLKRSWRDSDCFKSSLSGHIGIRTKDMGKEVYRGLIDKGVGKKDATAWAKNIADVFGKLKSSKNEQEALEIEQLAHFSPEEQAAINLLVDQLAASGKEPNKDDLALLRRQHTAADIALFGRMLASAPAYNTEAAAQVAHAISVHKVQVEDDFFTAIDDLNTGVEDVGAAHMGETEFGAAVYYIYICIDRQLLQANLTGDADLAKRTLAALIECATTVSPTGKQNSFASRAYASYAMAEKGNQQPRSLAIAYLKPVTGDNMMMSAIQNLEAKREKMEAVYGCCAAAYQVMNAETGDGTLQELMAFSTAE